LKLRRTVPLVAAGVMVVGTAITGAGSAAAATPERLCVASEDDVCAAPNGAYPVLMNNYSFSNFTEWLYNVPNHPRQIQLSGQDLCMQLDHDAGNTVILASCNGASYQKWNAFYAPGGWAFYSQWDGTQCLTYNRDYAELDTVTCNNAWYQSFNQGS
jgi:hypothetical protein